ncbi:hypothetical protein GCM10020218_103430 [Dactylosporangium vinaceum]
MPGEQLPHEAVYLHEADAGHFSEATPEVRARAQALYDSFHNLDEAAVKTWLRNNNIPITEDALTPSTG